MTPTRTGQIGDHDEYTSGGTMLAGCDRGTIDDVVACSRQWPTTYHRYRGTNGYVTWAHAGREIAASELPEPLRPTTGERS